MFLTELTADHWEGVIDNGAVKERPSSDDIEKALKGLDGSTRTLVTLRAEGETHMAIGGGLGRYVVYATFDNRKFHNLLGHGSQSEIVYLTAGGQEGDYPGNTIVDLATAIAVAKTFAESSQLDSRFKWQEQQ